jgi:protein-S-isoprenylcysteine O-methyltransferase Ste14
VNDGGRVAQIAQLAGAALVLAGFAASQLGWLTTRSAMYQTVNLAGSLILTAVALDGRLYGFVILNGVWAVVSLIALARIILGREKAA